MKTKLVNLRCNAAVPIDGVTYSGRVTNIELPIDTIRKCLLNRIRVEEVKPNGKTIPLGFDNYAIDTDEEAKPVVNTSKKENTANTTPNFKIYSYDRRGNKIDKPIYTEDVSSNPVVNKEKSKKEPEEISLNTKTEEKNTIQKNSKK